MRAGHSKDSQGLRVLVASPTEQPELPEMILVRGHRGTEEFPLPEATRQWWRMWAESPLSAEFTSTDWSELLDTSLLHARFWLGDAALASELRLRVAAFGATPADRARLRITFAQADEAEEKRAVKSPAKSRYRDLKAVE